MLSRENLFLYMIWTSISGTSIQGRFQFYNWGEIFKGVNDILLKTDDIYDNNVFFSYFFFSLIKDSILSLSPLTFLLLRNILQSISNEQLITRWVIYRVDADVLLLSRDEEDSEASARAEKRYRDALRELEHSKTNEDLEHNWHIYSRYYENHHFKCFFYSLYKYLITSTTADAVSVCCATS